MTMSKRVAAKTRATHNCRGSISHEPAARLGAVWSYDHFCLAPRVLRSSFLQTTIKRVAFFEGKGFLHSTSVSPMGSSRVDHVNKEYYTFQWNTSCISTPSCITVFVKTMWIVRLNADIVSPESRINFPARVNVVGCIDGPFPIVPHSIVINRS